MEMRIRRARGRSVSETALLCCFSICFFFSVFALMARTAGGSDCTGIRSSRVDSYTQEWTKSGESWSTRARAQARRRNLSGPGSYPPRCTSKCGKCTPCEAVHVTIPPGTPVTTEYYPEAWRCKCGDRLYIP